MGSQQNATRVAHACGGRQRLIFMLVFLVFLSASIAFAPFSADTAWGLDSRAQAAEAERWQHLPESTMQYETPGFQPEAYYEALFSDESTGVKIGRYVEASSSAEKPEAPIIESLNLLRGEECLHEEGACEACDELREMYRNGNVDALYRVEITTEYDGDGWLALTVPLDEKVSKYASYRCDDGVLKPSYMTVTAKVAERGFTSASIDGDVHDLRSPFGIAYNKDKPQEPTTAPAHAYTPDDGDGEEQPNRPTILLTSIAIIAAIIGVAYLTRRSSGRTKKR